MDILCDTCSVLMLIRITPNMFIDSQFECVTIPDVRNELFRTQKFKTKYPWRIQFKSEISTLGTSVFNTKEFDIYYWTIKNLIETGKINKRTGKYFDLSNVDQKIAACILSHDFGITTGDNNLIDFIIQEFSFTRENIVSPLGLINKWIKQKLINWNTNYSTILEEWNSCGEKQQPTPEIKTFENLTGCRYIGP